MSSDNPGTVKATPSFGIVEGRVFGVFSLPHPPRNDQKQSPSSKASLFMRFLLVIQFASFTMIVPEGFFSG